MPMVPVPDLKEPPTWVKRFMSTFSQRHPAIAFRIGGISYREKGSRRTPEVRAVRDDWVIYWLENGGTYVENYHSDGTPAPHDFYLRQ